MYLYDQLLQRADANRPVQVGLTGGEIRLYVFITSADNPWPSVAAIADFPR